MQLNTRILKNILIVVTIVAGAAMMLLEPIAQSVDYHVFADSRSWGHIPYFWNVVSNLGFLYVGILGLHQLFVTHRLKTVFAIRLNYVVFFIGVTLVALGSGYYHWRPDNHTLIWDRLPMTLAFMALMSFALGEFLSVVWARRAFLPLLCLGLASVIYWYWGEVHGAGDLRPYVLVQFLPMILLLVLFIFGQPVFDDNSGYWWLLAAYTLAKVFEHFDRAIFNLTHGMMAGHALKHVMAALGLYLLLRAFARRHQRSGI